MPFWFMLVTENGEHTFNLHIDSYARIALMIMN